MKQADGVSAGHYARQADATVGGRYGPAIGRRIAPTIGEVGRISSRAQVQLSTDVAKALNFEFDCCLYWAAGPEPQGEKGCGKQWHRPSLYQRLSLYQRCRALTKAME